MSEKLLPCPHCGGDAHWFDTFADGKDWGWVECVDCGALTKHGDRDTATARWNTRRGEG